MLLRVMLVTATLIAGATASAIAQPAPVISDEEKRVAEAPNVRLEVILTDKAEGKVIAEERLTVLVADRQLGRLRRHLPGNVPAFNRNFEVDVTPTVFGSRIRLALTVNYQTTRDSAAAREATKEIPQMVQFIETATSFVESGKPTMLIEATGDPANRRVTVQATATILR